MTSARAQRARPKLLFLVAWDWYFVCHRLPLAKAAAEAGFEVVVVTPPGDYVAQIEAAGLRHVPIALARQGRNPPQDLRTLLALIQLYRREAPDVVHHVAVKPVLYGSIAAQVTSVPAVVNALAGMGYVFLNRTGLSRVVRPVLERAYRLLLSPRNTRTILQNQDDLEQWIAWGVMRRDRTVLIRGAGVDTQKFAPSPEPEGAKLTVLPARLLLDKGVLEFVQAARTLRQEGLNARFALVGEPDLGNPKSVRPEQLKSWIKEGIIEHFGWRDDMHEVMKQSHLVCLPSYGEGLPKALLEAAASARAIVATDVPGCREIARHNDNALLVPARDAAALTAALRTLLTDDALRARMAVRGREIAEREFDQAHVATETIALYKELLAQQASLQAD